jgi:hypothetical protein
MKRVKLIALQLQSILQATVDHVALKQILLQLVVKICLIVVIATLPNLEEPVTKLKPSFNRKTDMNSTLAADACVTMTASLPVMWSQRLPQHQHQSAWVAWQMTAILNTIAIRDGTHGSTLVENW